MKSAVFLFTLLMAVAGPAAAHHPGDRLDEVMVEKEPAFEPTDQRDAGPAGFTLLDGSGVILGDLDDRIVVLSFASVGCGAPCIEQQALLRRVQASVNVTPMREMVLFVTVGLAMDADPSWEPVNWRHATPRNGATADLADAFAALSARGYAEPMAHILDRGGRHAGIFHGAAFGQVNLVLYINALTDARMPEPGLLDRIVGVFDRSRGQRD